MEHGGGEQLMSPHYYLRSYGLLMASGKGKVIVWPLLGLLHSSKWLQTQEYMGQHKLHLVGYFKEKEL